MQKATLGLALVFLCSSLSAGPTNTSCSNSNGSVKLDYENKKIYVLSPGYENVVTLQTSFEMLNFSESYTQRFPDEYTGDSILTSTTKRITISYKNGNTFDRVWGRPASKKKEFVDYFICTTINYL